ncbi:hypothetical protein VO178_05990 [Lysinibacillus fusiformis]|uniref:hypothetical protein n=1 Tax=Lysinibacillus fusiformis TaxID=28031 RepID=UPI002D79312A|nr:hypothetical protein [Lysinibacillus fusiformis]WRS99231.1 hypothetical protein VO178_05990 [Lysinibacillus fusiformis]
MKIQTYLYVVGYSILYFLLSVTIYFISFSSGFNGLALPVFGGGDDGQFYYEQTLKFINNESYVYTSIHIWILGIVLKVFNTENVMVLRIFNFTGSFLLIILALLILKKIATFKAFHISASSLVVLLSFYPSLLLNSTLSIYRDVWIYTFFLWCSYLFINIFIAKGRWPRIVSGILLIVGMLTLGGYRKYALLSFLIGAGIYLFLNVFNRKNLNLLKVSGILFVGLTVFYIFFKNMKIPVLGLSISDVLKYRQLGLEAGGSQMGISLDQPNVLLFYVNYLYSLISNFIGPLPWQVTGGSTLIIMMTEGSVFLIIFIYLIRKVRFFSKVEVFLLIQSIVWFLLISISNDNFGTGSRLRIIGWLPLIIIFAKFLGENIYNKKIRKVINK